MKEQPSPTVTSPPINITWTDLNKGYSDIPPAVVDFLREQSIHDFNDHQPGDKIDKVAVAGKAGTELSIRFLRPKSKGGIWKRLSLKKDLVKAVQIEKNSKIQFEVRNENLFLNLIEDRGKMNDIHSIQALTEHGNGGKSAAIIPSDLDSVALTYPNAFEKWFGKGSGSVKRPFAANTGRPLGRVLKTPLLERLEVLAENIVSGKNKPKLVMLAGGAGNGKSDALEEFLKALCQHAETTQKGLPILESAFAGGGRKVEISGSDIISPKSWLKQLAIIQDATEGNDTGSSTGRLLAEDVEKACTSNDTLLIVCVNRGILEDARHRSEKQNLKLAGLLINDCIDALNPLSIDLPCWPLQKHSEVYLWPLDIASLADGDCPVIKQVLKSVAEGKWNESSLPEKSSVLCNLRLLQDDNFRSNLTRILRHHEVLSGQRWTFREVFHLVGHLMTGGKLRGDGEKLEECAIRLVADNEGSVEQEVATTFDACRATIPHVLFAEWPSHQNFQNCVKHLSKEADGELLKYTKAFCKYLEKDKQASRSIVERMLCASFRQNLDPAAGMPPEWMLEVNGISVTERELDDAFSTSVASGMELTESMRILTVAESTALKILKKIERELEEVVDGTVTSDAILHWKNAMYWLRRLANIISKRSLSVSSGMGRKSHHAIRFLETINSPKLMQAEKRGITSILEEDGSYVVPLNLSLGQPRGTAKEPPLLKVEPPRIETGRSKIGPELRPSGLYREFHAIVTRGKKSVVIPYTLELFCRLRSLEEGLLEGCLDGMARGCLDQIRLALDGHAVRAWGKDSRIEIDLGDGLGKFTGYSDELDYTADIQ